ncbi:MAG: rod shape-determining protein MreD [Rhodocyclaceae bacterium]|nr:rod shape-determining protein MreD [Rhodocyclaceae bacterium]
MQPTNRSQRILQPVKLWYLYLSLIVAFALTLIPTGHLPGVPDWLALVLAFWSVREPLRVGLGTGFAFGLLVDVGHGAALGQHALAYVLLTYGANALSRRVLWFSPLEQALHILPLLLLMHVVMVVVRMLAGADFPGWWYFTGSFTAALLWVPLHFVLLFPQFRPVERDDNRPI